MVNDKSRSVAGNAILRLSKDARRQQLFQGELTMGNLRFRPGRLLARLPAILREPQDGTAVVPVYSGWHCG